MPSRLLQNYTISDIVSVNYHNTVYEVLSKSNDKTYILKILSRKYFPKTLYDKIFSLDNAFLLLPVEKYDDKKYVYLVFPQYKTLSDILFLEGLTWDMLKQFASDIGQAISALHKQGILHLDIRPQNIFMDSAKHFYLGDFSSASYARRPLIPVPLFTERHLRTGTCPFFAPPKEYDISIQPYYPDLYSYALLLFMLLHDGNRPALHKEQDAPFCSETDAILYRILFPKEDAVFTSEDTIFSLNAAITHYIQETDCQRLVVFPHLDADSPCDLALFAEDRTPFITPVKKEILSHKFPSASAFLYGFFFICSCIFLFTLYYVFSPKADSTQIQLDSQYVTASTAPAVYIATTTTPSAILSVPSEPKETPAANLKPKPSKNVQKILFAGNKQLQNCSAYTKFSDLEELYLNDNSITSLSGLSHLNHLKVLSLSNNHLRDISVLGKLKSLIILDLSHNNRLKNISCLSGLNKLQYLIVTNTNIRSGEISFLKKKLPLCTIFY